MITKTIIIPCFNEKNTITKILEKVQNFKKYEKEIIIVDDGSTDGTQEILKKIETTVSKIIFHEKNSGKGRAIRSALEHVSGDVTINQDADLEYDPEEYLKLLKPFEIVDADVVYGSRFSGGGGPQRVLFFWHSVANKLLTFFSNIFTNFNLSDMETGYKVFKTKCLKSITLEENSFGFEAEVTIKLAKKKYTFFEVPISYYGRTYEEGKKIGFKDGIRAVYVILKYFIFTRK